MCDYCLNWMHAECEDISLDNYKAYSKLEIDFPYMTYFFKLNHCKEISTGVLKKLGPVEAKIEQNEERITGIEAKMNEHKQKIETKVEEKL